jgi:hypothetical protein
MPFISIRVIRTDVPLTLVESFSAGGRQIILCDTIVTLNGSVDAPEGTYTFEWEQIDGTPVILEDADTLSPWFVNPNIGDFVFRLWINRYTSAEMFDDVTVYRQPADVATNLLGTQLGINRVSNVENSRFESIDRVVQSVSVEPTSFADQNRTILQGQAIVNFQSAMLEWAVPSGDKTYSTFLGVEVQRWDTFSNDWVFEYFQPAHIRYYNITNTDLYRLVSVWSDGLRGVISKEVDVEVYRSPENRAIEGRLQITGIDVSRNIGNRHGEPRFLAVNRITAFLEDFEDTGTSNIGNDSGEPRFLAVNRITAFLEDFEDTGTSNIGNDSGEPRFLAVNRLSGTSIGGGG